MRLAGLRPLAGISLAGFLSFIVSPGYASGIVKVNDVTATGWPDVTVVFVTIQSAPEPDNPTEPCTCATPETSTRQNDAVPVAEPFTVVIALAVMVPDDAAPKPVNVCVDNTVLPDSAVLALVGGVPEYRIKSPVPTVVSTWSAIAFCKIKPNVIAIFIPRLLLC